MPALGGKTASNVFFLRVKIHKLTIATTVSPTISIGALKSEILSALTSVALGSNQDDEEMPTSLDIPSVTDTSEFELCTAEKETGKLTGVFPVLRNSKQSIRDAGIVNWDVLFVRFKDVASGALEPVVFVPIEDDEEQITPQFAEAISVQGKRKARPD
ncbi:hypothetical protein MIND_00787100 [Mycena indigotica]|uniref:Uncharacterized protein n=1 Tax=Mycena indigotica TaxID=2126181 RepID=A0A8H6SPW3_9AGAR|nr:uncharacterized protein MIND_00787100 [Mycena indigotica]KAF7302202.1 hypothetical protein MIND_00787100 [Mycena indigotica]